MTHQVMFTSSFRSGFLRRWSGESGLVAMEEAFEDGDGGREVVAEEAEQVDVVEVAGAAEAVGEVVAGVDGGEQVAF